MATKWKNKWKIIAWIMLFVVGLGYTLSGINSFSYYAKQDYFQTDEFRQGELEPFLSNLKTLELGYMTPEEWKKNLTVTDEEIHQHRYRYGDLEQQVQNIKDQYAEKIQIARNTNDTTLEKAAITERDAKIKDITENFTNDEHVRQKIVKEKEALIDTYDASLRNDRATFNDKKEVFSYYFKNRDTGKVYTNVNVNSLQELNAIIKKEDVVYTNEYNHYTVDPFIHVSHPDYESSYTESEYSLSDITNNIPSQSFEGKIFILKTAFNKSDMKVQQDRYKESQLLFFIQFFIGIVALLTSVLLYRKTAIKEHFTVGQAHPKYAALPIDLKVLALGFSIICTYFFITSVPYSLNAYLEAWRSGYFSSNVIWQIKDCIIPGVLLVITFIQWKWVIPILKDEEMLKTEWENSYTKKLIKASKEVFMNRSFGKQAFFLLAVIFFGGVGAISVVTPFVLIYAPLFIFIFLPTLYIIIKNMGYLSRITQTAMNISNGYFEKDLPVKGKSPLANLAQSINNMKNNVNTSQQAQAKSERLKTELISNVSHDLRTPLTSIITYSDLLKSGNLTEDERNTYIEIIDRKSKRLKVLIDDLFEASKMATGNIELKKERVDIAQLLKQSLAELDDKIQESTLQFRPVIKEEPLYAVVDGPKLWRVFDNLINNILKYSMDHSRVYITLEKGPNTVDVTFKNISKYELGMGTDELFERFKRGDTSRHTEGSGLGLAIAKSIVDLHGGKMLIDTDGDLFTVTVSVPTV